jgi:hypothetical protein
LLLKVSALNKTLLGWLVGFVYNEELFTSQTSFEEITAMHPWLVGFFSGNTTNLQHFRGVEGEMFQNLKPYIHKTPNKQNVIFHFLPQIGRCDHPAAQMADGNKVGGHYRCEKCR